MKHLFAKEAEPAAPDELTTAKESVAKLAAALATAENESTETRTAYDREMRDFIANGKVEPSLEGQRVAAEKCDSLRRLLSEAREHLARVASEAEAAKRHDAIRASGSRVAELTTTAEAKLATFQSAVNACGWPRPNCSARYSTSRLDSSSVSASRKKMPTSPATDCVVKRSRSPRSRPVESTPDSKPMARSTSASHAWPFNTRTRSKARPARAGRAFEA